MTSRDGNARTVWVLASLIILLSYGIASFIALRAGLFDFTPRPLTPTEYTALWSYAGATGTAAVTLAVATITNSQFYRSERRLGLEASVRSLELLAGSEDGGGYAPKAVVAGSLASLVQLGQPVLAIRALQPAWNEDAVGLDSAIWIIGQVLLSHDSVAQRSAVALLVDITKTRLQGGYALASSWPAPIWENWMKLKNADDETRLLTALARWIEAHPRDYWEGARIGYFVATLYTAAAPQNRSHTQGDAGRLLDLLIPLLPEGLVSMDIADNRVSLTQLKKRARKSQARGDTTANLQAICDKLEIQLRQAE